MSFVLDSIRRKELLESPESVSAEWVSPVVSLDDREGEFSIMVMYQNGISPSMSLILQISSDNVNFADVTESVQSVSDESGSHIWDIAGSGALYLRVKIAVSAGSLEVSRIIYAGKQRH
jgi:hypothetical protein